MLFAKSPKRTLSIGFKEDVPDGEIKNHVHRRKLGVLKVSPRGPWRLWANLIDGRLDQSRTYTLGIDIGKGMGASNSVISVMCNETKEKVMEFADANTPPYELARVACAAALWVGGRTRPLIIWENNGDPGFDFGRQITHVYNYPNIYFDRMPGTMGEKKGKRYGWRSSPEKKATALGMLRRAYAHGGFVNHSEEALAECLTYVHYENGGIGPAELVEESESARKAHGDRVIADMLCVVAQGEAPAHKEPERHVPERSIAYRLQRFQRRKKRRQQSDTFDFRGAA